MPPYIKYEAFGSSPASPTNEFLRKHLSLTRIEAAKLCAFPPHVIELAVAIIKIDQPNSTRQEITCYETLKNYCLEYCVAENITLDYVWAEKMEEYAQRMLAKGLS